MRAEQLLGLRALDLSNNLAEIGVVEKVLNMAETGAAQPLLVVRAAGGAGAGQGGPREEHRIPFVPQIVPSLDPAAGVVYVEPPPGLLDLGRQQRVLEELGRELEPFTLPKPRSVLQRMGLRLMPTAAQLEAAGRRDLAQAVRRAGGFLEVAQALGLRSQRKPAGFWEDEVNLDEELTLFVAAHWCKFSDPETRQSYWYNQITHGVSWEEPVLPERIEIDDDGGYILTEAEEDRVMPSRSAIFAAGRYDLHNAIMLHGGYIAASKLLDRRPAWPPSQHLRSLPRLRHELKEFVAETGLPRNQLPTASQLLSAGRGDLCQAIIKRGGFVEVASRLGWGTHRRGRRQWKDPLAVAREVRRFILDTQLPELAGDRGAGGEQEECATPLPPGARMPTHRQLAAAGRHDLRYALQQHGSSTIGAMLGIELDSRGAHKRQDAGSS